MTQVTTMCVCDLRCELRCDHSFTARHTICTVKWALGSIATHKASGGDGIPVELFQVLEDDAVTVMHSVCQQIWKTQQWPKDWKRSVFIPIPKKGNAKKCLKYCPIALISHTSKVISLLFNMPSRLVIAFFPRSKCLLISWLQLPSAMILEHKK